MMEVFNSSLASDILMNANFTSAAIPLVNSFGYAIQAVYTGTPTGSIKLQVSADPYKYATPAQPPIPTNWDDLANSTFSITAAGVTIWNVTGAFYNYVRLVYTDGSSGASTAKLNALINSKGA